jgi:NAD(P)H dehydrogenase (quinone)
MSQTLLVTGASGQLGRAVLSHLLDTLKVDPARLVAVSRKVEALSELAERGVAVRKGDFDDPASLDRAFAGASRLLLISTDSLEGNRRLEQHLKAVAAAERAEVRHLVYTSLPEAERSAISFAPDHAGTEKALFESRIPGLTVLRNSWYSENLAHSLPGILKSGLWYSAAGDGAISYIARADLALAAAHALAADNSGRTTLTLTGERAYAAAEVANLFSTKTGRRIEVVPVSPAELTNGLVGAGFPESLARVFVSFDAAAAAGHLGIITQDFERLTGVLPQSFERWVASQAPVLLAA